jgi:serine/threonine-protein kinase RsbW
MAIPLTEFCAQEVFHHGMATGPEWRRHSFRTAAEVVPLIDGVVAELEAAGYTAREAFAVRLALEEAMVNALKHGHRNDPSKVAQLRYHLTPECVLAEVEDQGDGFDPNAVPDPLALENLEKSSGRGLLLMRTYMTWVRYNAAGTCVSLCLRRKTS